MTKPMSPPGEGEAQLTYEIKHAARLLGVSETTLHRQIKAGHVRKVYVFGMPRIAHDELMRCIKGEVAA